MTEKNIKASLKVIWERLAYSRKRQFVFLTLMMIVSAFLEVIGLGAVIPFISLLVSSEDFLKIELIKRLVDMFHLTSLYDIRLFFTAVFISAIVVSSVARLLLLKLSTKFAYACGSDISAEVYRRTLFQDYSVHVQRNSSEVIGVITSKVGLAVNVLYSVVTLMSSTILFLTIAGGLLYINPAITLISSFVFGFCYLILSRFTKKELHQKSQTFSTQQTKSIKLLQEGLSGIRDILLDSNQNYFCDLYKKADRPLREAKGRIIYLSLSPKYMMEAVGIILISIMAFLLVNQGGGFTEALPKLGVFALGAQRLLPIFQQMYTSWASIQGDQISLHDTVILLNQKINPLFLEPMPQPLQFSRSIEMKNISFSYSKKPSENVLKNIQLTIKKGTRVGFVGVTGSGKSTITDILMGLLKPDQGQIEVDGHILTDIAMRSWQQNIANVPQMIHLADASFIENIAFGVAPDKVDFEKVKIAAEKAQLSEFIQQTENQYQTVIGEKGVRLSGGQRQRIGIARAFYKNAQVIIFDEATSALDNTTEQSVMKSLDVIDQSVTLIIVAHRLSTVKNCDVIFEMHQGQLVAAGSYQELVEKSPSFKKMSQNA